MNINSSHFSNQALPVITDIHGDSIALGIIIEYLHTIDIKRPPLILGDLFWSEYTSFKENNHVLDMILNMDTTAVIQGNTDEKIMNDFLENWEPDNMKDKLIKMNLINQKSQMSYDQKKFLINLKQFWTGKIKSKKIYAAHASPKNIEKGLDISIKTDDLNDLINNVKCDILITGHLHQSFTRLIENGILHVSVGAAGKHPYDNNNNIIEFSIIDEKDNNIIVYPIKILKK